MRGTPSLAEQAGDRAPKGRAGGIPDGTFGAGAASISVRRSDSDQLVGNIGTC